MHRIAPCAPYLPRRASDTNKYDYGRVLIVGGCIGYTGAPTLCARAALRCGAGLVSVGVPEAIYAVTAVKNDAAMPFPLPSADGKLTADALPELLERLRAHGFRVAVATGKPTPMARSILQRFDLERLFDCVIGCEYDGSRSTKAEVVAAVLAETHTPPEAALMVGDRKYDVTGAAACGVPCLGVYYGYAEPGELEAAGAVTTVQTVAELSERLLHWNEA